MKTVMVLALVAIVAVLAGAGVFMLRGGTSSKGQERSKRMARALALRVALSVSLFLFVLLAYLMGWIQPTGIPVQR